MELSLLSRLPQNFKGVFIVPFFETKEIEKSSIWKSLLPTDRKYLKKVVSAVKWSEKETRLITLPSAPEESMLLLSLGERKKWHNRRLVSAVRRAIRSLKDHHLPTAAWAIGEPKGFGLSSDILSLIVRNILLADFEFTEYKEVPKEGWPEIKEVLLITETTPALKRAWEEGLILGEEMNRCRRLVNLPGGMLPPRKLAEKARHLAKTYGFKARVLGESEMRKLGMGGILSVAQGSDEPPQFIILEYGSSKKKPLVFVGKGVTFDTGGLNLKSETGMTDMHMDKAGAAAVLHAVAAIVRLKLPVRVIGLIPTVENMPSGKSYKPGDIIKTITGKTVEVLNTDAEGRIILADALGYAQRFKPSLIVDLATLTGAAMVALGQRTNALFTNQEKLYAFGREIGELSGDYAWPMPLWEEYDEEIKGTFGDIVNLGKTKYGGAITGAAFLKQFVGDWPWIHLDIAPMMTTLEGQYLAKGAFGVGVAFLVEVAKRWRGGKDYDGKTAKRTLAD